MDRGNTKQAIPNTLVKDVNELWVSGRKNLDVRADGCISKAELIPFDV